MKKIFFLLCCAVFVSGGSFASAAAPSAPSRGGFAPAPNAAGGGFSGPAAPVTSAKDAATMRDDAPVVLRGSITQRLGKDRYLFRDASGDIRVEIDDDAWQGQTVTPDDAVELYGEIDKDWNSVEVEADRIVKLP